jgi:hypothetical protein
MEFLVGEVLDNKDELKQFELGEEAAVKTTLE